jgi:hypothetical protein
MSRECRPGRAERSHAQRCFVAAYRLQSSSFARRESFAWSAHRRTKMKTITASWMISCALVCGCSGSAGSDGDNGLGGAPNTPADDSYEDGNHEYAKPSPKYTFTPPCWQLPSKDIPLVPSYPDPEQDSGPAGEEGSQGGGTENPTLPTVIPPTVVDGNPTCSDVFDNVVVQALDVTMLKDGTYSTTDKSFSVTLDFDNDHVSYTVSGGLVGVIVKGGPHSNVYTTTAQTGDVNTAAGEEISHVTFCHLAE